MGFDLHICGSETCLTPLDKEYKIQWESNNDFRFSIYIDLSWEDDLSTMKKIVVEAPVFVKDNCDSDFTFNTGIWEWDDFFALKEENYPDISRIQEQVKEYPKTKYLFIALF